MIYLKLFLNFLMIGALSFGGGYGMVSLVRETVISNGWLTESEFLNFIAVSESTPGPLAVNMATFIGSTQGGILGSFLATLGVVLPSFVIILLIAAVLKNLNAAFNQIVIQQARTDSDNRHIRFALNDQFDPHPAPCRFTQGV